MELRKTFRFEASHILPRHPGKCSRLHGHSWVLHVWVKGPVNPDTGFVQDFADISTVMKPLVERLDHRHLGAWDIPWTGLDLSPNLSLNHRDPPEERWSVEGLPKVIYPSSENLLWWIAGQIKGLDIYGRVRTGHPHELLKDVRPGQIIEANPGEFVKRFVEWNRIALEETCTSYCELGREEFDAQQH